MGSVQTSFPPRPKSTLQLLLWLWFAFYCSVALISPPLFDDADSVHAEVAREMILRHDPVTLYANGIRYLEKAPLLYWSMAGSMRLLGVHTSTARLPLALFTLGLILLAERFGREAFRTARAGLYAGCIVLSSFGVFIFTRILIPDAIVCLWLLLAVWCFWRMELDDGKAPLGPCLGFGAACALNILTKGLIGLVFPLGTVIVYLLLTRGITGTLSRIRELRPVAALLTFLLLAAPWHLAAARANSDEGHALGLTHTGRWLPFFWRGWSVPDPTPGNVHGWAWFYFVNEHLLRYLDLRVPRDYDTVPLLLFWGLLFIWLLPWSAFLPPAIAAAPWRRLLLQARYRLSTIPLLKTNAHTTQQDPLDPREKTMLLLTIAAILPVLFFSFSTRQEYYVLPSLPFLALLLASWMDREAHEAEALRVPAPLHRTGMRVAIGLLVFGGLFAVVAAFFLVHSAAPSPGVDLASLLRQNPGDYALSFGHFLDLNAQAMGLFRLPLGLAGGAFFVGTLAAWWLRREYRPHAANLVLLATTMTFLLAAHVGLTTFSPVLTSRVLANAIHAQAESGDLIVINGEYEAGSSLGFYLHRNDLHLLHGHSANLWYGSFFHDAPAIFETDESLRTRWLSTQRIFLWTTPETLPKLPAQVYPVAESGGKEIVSNQPNRLPEIKPESPPANPASSPHKR